MLGKDAASDRQLEGRGVGPKCTGKWSFRSMQHPVLSARTPDSIFVHSCHLAALKGARRDCNRDPAFTDYAMAEAANFIFHVASDDSARLLFSLARALPVNLYVGHVLTRCVEGMTCVYGQTIRRGQFDRRRGGGNGLE